MRVDNNSKPHRGVAPTHKCKRAAHLHWMNWSTLNISCGLDSVNKHAEHRQSSISFLKKTPTRKWPNIFIVNASADQILFYFLCCIHHILFPILIRHLAHPPLFTCGCVHACASACNVRFSLSRVYGFYCQFQCVTGVNVHIIVATGGWLSHQIMQRFGTNRIDQKSHLNFFPCVFTLSMPLSSCLCVCACVLPVCGWRICFSQNEKSPLLNLCGSFKVHNWKLIKN